VDRLGRDVRSDLAEREEMSLCERAELADGLGGEQAPVAGYPSAVVVVDLQPAVLGQPPQDVFAVFEHDVADWELVQQRRVGVVPGVLGELLVGLFGVVLFGAQLGYAKLDAVEEVRLWVFAGFEAVDEPALPGGQVGDLVS
jgi:hypothetical protein